MRAFFVKFFVVALLVGLLSGWLWVQKTGTTKSSGDRGGQSGSSAPANPEPTERVDLTHTNGGTVTLPPKADEP